MARASLITLLSNYACQVGQRGAKRLYCTCRGNVITGLLVVGTAIAALSIVPALLFTPVLIDAGRDRDAAVGFVGMLLGLALAGGSAYLAVQRYQRHGRFELDGERGVLRRYRAGRLTGEYGFDKVRSVWLSLDMTDSLALLHGTPTWLQIAFSTGEIFRLAKGSPKELEPVCDAMRELGLSVRRTPAAAR